MATAPTGEVLIIITYVFSSLYQPIPLLSVVEHKTTSFYSFFFDGNAPSSPVFGLPSELDGLPHCPKLG